MSRHNLLQPSRRHGPAPLHQLDLYLTDGCSLTCRNCMLQALPALNGKKTRFLPFEMAMQAVFEAVPLGLGVVRLIGNDALLHPNLATLLDWLESLEVAVVLETDGRGMTDEHAAHLASLPRCSVAVAVDGVDAATHNAIHKAQGAFEMATNAIDTLAKAGLAASVVFSLQRSNAGQLADVVHLAEELGAGGVRFSVVRPGIPDAIAARAGLNGKNNGHASKIHPPFTQELHDLHVEELIAMGRRVERELASTTRLNLHFDQPPAFRGLQPQAHVEGETRCRVLNTLGLLASGEWALCGVAESIPELVFGQAGSEPLENIWHHHPALEQLRQGMPDRLEGICERCTMKQACLGYCAVENYFQSGSFWGPHWFCESAERVGLFPAGRLIENTW